jgi:hypothetical protein
MTPQKPFNVKSVIALARLALLTCVACGLSGLDLNATTDEFQPVRRRLTYSTDMSPVDIEVVGSTSLVPQFHQLIPDLVLRFRLARAYVDLYAERDPGFEILSIGVDFDTMSPIALFEAAIAGPQFSKDVPGIPKLQPTELRRRGIHLYIESAARAESLQKFGDLLANCRGQRVENELSTYERVKDCPQLGYRRFGRIAQLENGLLIKIECDDKDSTTFAKCETRVPFKGFIVGLHFNRELLPHWREVIRFSEDFLKSKQYQQDEAH